MTEQDTPSGGLSWLERLGQAIKGEPRDRQELLELLRDAADRHLLDADVLSMIEGALQVSEMKVRDVMVPRAQAVMVQLDAPLETVLNTMIESAHSRYPVIAENRDEVVGILLAKDILPYLVPGSDGKLPVPEVMRPVVFVPESKRLNVMLRDFRSSRNHMAVVVDEYGGVAGLVTIEDVLEEIVGEIDDEHDQDEDQHYIRRQNDTEFLVKALTPIEDFNETFHMDLADDEFDTVGGLILKAFGRLPDSGERTRLGLLEFEVIKSDGRRLHLLKVTVPASEAKAVEV